jgi:FtsH-binding integral membrane protein
VAEAIIMLPLLWIAAHFSDKTLIPTAGILTLAVFGGLTLAAFTSRKDFSILGPILSVGFMIALGVIIAGLIFGFTLGLFFSFAMVALLSGCILFQTSQIMYHFPTDKYVAAALMLFSSIATLFWYILRILMILNSSRD